ncbi:MAG: hypothetical protein NZ959_04610 [Armatimonadetes bacterium]|nr:hypothetical protein [Armatimonadota bacterium]MDW8121845.1 hypothetical protein [Armatimonadota bacterium]
MKSRVSVSVVAVWGILLFVALAISQPRAGLEVQLAGVRLGSPAIERDATGALKPTCLLRVWGLPDFLVMLPGGGMTVPQTGAPAGPGAVPGVGPGMPGGFPGFGPGGMPGIGGALGGMGSGFGGQPMLGAQMPAMGMMGQMAGAPGAMGGLPGPLRGGQGAGMPGPGMMGGMPGMMGGMPGMMGGMPGMMGPGAMGAGPGAGAGAGAGAAAVPTPGELAWAVPVWIQVQPNQHLWLYKRGDAALSFLVTGDLIVAGITVAGRQFDKAKTALGDPFKTIKLGDDFQRVLLRYGPPDEVLGFNLQTLQPTSAMMTRNLVLRYHRSSNIEFTLLNYKVVRIFIFLPERVTVNP